MKRKVLRIGVGGTLAALAVSSLGIPSHAAESLPPTPGISVEATIMRSIAAPPAVEVSGAAQIDQQLYADDGTGWGIKDPWSTRGTTKRFQWLRNGAAIPGAVSSYYKVQPVDAGARLSFSVTGSANGFAAVTRISDSTIPVLNKTSTPRIEAELPFVWDKPPAFDAPRTVGTLLSAELDVPWLTSVPVGMKYQWLRNGVPIPGATALEYRITTADLGASIVLRSQGINAGRTLETIDAAPIRPSKQRTVTVKRDRRGQESYASVSGYARVSLPLWASAPGWTQTGVKTTYQWLRNGSPIAGAKGVMYVPVDADAGKQVSVAVTGTRTGLADTTVEGFAHMKVAPGPPRDSAPRISGTATVGSVLTAIKGTWRMPTNVWFRWQRNGVDIKGASDLTKYRLTAADKRARITVVSTIIVPGTSRPGLAIASNPVTVR